jgi:hypothetical protein
MNQEKRTPPFVLGPFKLLLGTVGAAVGCGVAIYILMTGIQARTWTETKAVMQRCDLMTGRKGKQSLSLAYEYAFAGRTYSGTRYGFADGESIESRLNTFAAGKEVRCFVNPKNPEQAMLRRRMSALYWAMPVGFLLFAVGLGYATRKTILWYRQTDSDAVPMPEPAIS